MHKILFAILLSVLALTIVLILFPKSKGHKANGSGGLETAASNDPLLKQLREQNPQFQIDKRLKDDFDRVPVFWVKDSSSEHSFMMPESLIEGPTTIKFESCDLTKIPQHLLYPNATEPICVQITNQYHKLSAFYFSAKTRMKDIVDYYDGPARNGARHLTRWEENSLHQGKLPDGTIGFLYSYYFYEAAHNGQWELSALVGYKIDR